MNGHRRLAALAPAIMGAIAAAALTLLGAVAATVSADEAASPALEVSDAWARATPPGASVAAVYLTIQGGAESDRLVAASTPRAADTQIHSVTEDAGMTRMRPIEGIAIPPRTSVHLAPQAEHLMLMGLVQPLVAGERFTVTLEFAAAGKRDATVEVRTPTSPAPR
jgi:copper(I)-binding protein